MPHSRRSFIASSLQTTAVLCGTGVSLAGKKLPPKPIKLGLIADLHHQFVDGGRKRLDAFLAAMEIAKPNGIVQLGDFTFPNAGGKAIADAFNAAAEHSLHVIGNHDLDLGLTRKHCMDAWGMSAPYYRQDLNGLRLLVLDGNEKGSPKHKGGYPSYIGEKQIAWLASELEATDLPTIVISHQPLAGPSAVDSAAAVQQMLSAHREKVLLCLNGHTHLDAVVKVDGIFYIHINSASYYWVGGKTRTLFYRDPLFGTLTIDPASGKAALIGQTSRWDGPTPEDIGYFHGKKEALRGLVTPNISDRSLLF